MSVEITFSYDFPANATGVTHTMTDAIVDYSNITQTRSDGSIVYQASGSMYATVNGNVENLHVDNVTYFPMNGASSRYDIVASDGTHTINFQYGNQSPTTINTEISNLENGTNHPATVVVENDIVAATSMDVNGSPSSRPTISNTHTTTDTAEASVTPFGASGSNPAVTIVDPTSGATDSLQITLSGGGGTLAGAGLTGSGTTYALAAASPATLTSELDALTFTPTNATPGATISTTFALAVSSSSGSMASDSGTVVTDTAAAAPPAGGGTDGGGTGGSSSSGGGSTPPASTPSSGNIVTFSSTLPSQGNDNVAGTAGNDQILGFQGDDSLSGLAGNDSIYGGMGADTLLGDQGADLLSGNRGNDLLHGGMGADSLYGGKGNDVLFGDKGDDYLSGDQGSDTFAFNPGDTDFKSGVSTGDTIGDFLSGTDQIDFTTGPAGTASNFKTAGTTSTDFGSIQAEAQSLISGGSTYVFVADGVDGFLFTTGGQGTTITDAVKLAGAGSVNSLQATDIHGGAVA